MPQSETPPSLNLSAAEFYQARLQSLQQEADDLNLRSRRLSRWRGTTFFPALAAVLYTWLDSSPSYTGYYLGGMLFAVFVRLAGHHEQVAAQLATNDHRRKINQQHLHRLNREFDQLVLPAVSIDQDHEPTARDLDLFGRNSLFQWLCLCQTPLGRDTLRDWLLCPAGPDEVRSRQQAVARLAPEQDLREEFQLRGRILAAGPYGAGAFLEWAEGPPWLAAHATLKWIARISAVLMIALIALMATNLLPSAGWLGVLALLSSNAMINFLMLPPIHRIFESVASKQNEVANHRELFALVSNVQGDDQLLARLRQRMGDDGREPLTSLSDLQRRVALANARNSPIWGLVYLALQYVLLWDFHVLDVLEHWQRAHGHRAREWFAALGEFESLLSFSGVAFDQPTWAYASVAETHDRFVADALGHPLIDNTHRVTNDVQIGPSGTFLLVTGSNMSGKSTLLRSVGLNVLLAQAGCPTCASRCDLPPLNVATSMRVGDSLNAGVSFYMAELQRLKQVVDAARPAPDQPDRRLIYLLDEILLGTNSAERQIAVVRVIRHLLNVKAMGAISTHDIELANSPEITKACDPVHFREQIIQREGRDEMTFDYRMRKGVATTTNALKLLEMVGLTETS